MALAKLGEVQQLLALTDNTNQGRVMNRIYAQVRDAEVRRYNWKFAIKRVQLMALVSGPDWGFQYQYPLPSDFLKLIQVNDYYIQPYSKQKALWSIEGGNVLTDLQAPLKVRYVQRVTNAGLFDPLFAEAFACKLAFEACIPLTQSATRKQELADQYKFAINEAMRVDAIENPPDDLPWGSWLDSREGPNVGLDASGWSAYPSSTEVL
jgi:hypothetical protein